MAVFATPLGRMPGAIVITADAQDGATLVWDAENGVFVTQNPTGGSGTPIDTIESAGLPAGADLVVSGTGPTATLRSLIAGPGIQLTVDPDTVTISRVGDSPAVSNTDYTIIIDADGDEPGAVFSVERGVSPSLSTYTPTPPTPFIVDDAFLDNDPITLRGYIETRDGLDFTTTGLTDLDIVRVTNTLVDDGDKFVVAVSTTGSSPVISRLEFEQSWPNQNLGGPRDGILVEAAPLYVRSGQPSPSHDPARLYILRVHGADFSPTGLDWRAGDTVRISGTEGGLLDGTYLLWGVEAPDPLRGHPDKWTALIFDPSTPLPTAAVEGTVLSDPVNGPVLLERLASTASTGFTVRDDGVVNASAVFVTTLTPTATNELTSKSYVDGVVAGLVDVATHNADIAALDARVTTLEADVTDLRRRLRSTWRFYITDVY